MKYIFFTFCCALFFTGCKNDPVDSSDIYVGGQINNPETDYVILSRGEEDIDTLYLNKQNQFGKNFSNLETGMYTFKHPPENQVLYVEPGDSLLIWSNTISFDESLNFSGKGAEESNFLLDLFLKNQKNNDLILTYYKIEPQEFARISDSIRNDRMATLDQLKKDHDFKEDFLNIARATIDYEYYDLRERYTFLIEKYYPKFAEKIPANFHNYREKIDFNDTRLQEYYVYTNLIDDYLRSRSIKGCDSLGKQYRKECYDLNSFINLERRILLVDSLIELENLRNDFLDRFANQSIIRAESESRIDSILQLLRKVHYSQIDRAQKLSEVQKSYFVGASINNKTVLNSNAKLLTYKEIIDKPTVNLSWSIYAPAHHRWLHGIVKKLRKKYPEITFNMINIDGGDYEKWMKVVEASGYNKKYQYQIANRSEKNEMYTYYLTKVIFVTPDGTIVKGDISYSTLNDFEEDIKEFKNIHS